MAIEPGAGDRTRRLVVFLLRAGLVAGCLLTAAGVVLAVSEGRLRSHPVALGDLIRFIETGRPSGFMAAGVALLVLTPLARVVALAAGFLREGDLRFAVVALSVAAILVLGVIGGHV